jgi:hypothetical protein
MTTRVQTLRSSTTGAVPAAGTRSPGELWTNFPDLQIGVIDAAKNPQKLVGVRYFSTTANYVSGDFVIQAGKLYVATTNVTAGAFNSGQWSQIAALTDIPPGYVLPTASTTVLGGVKIDGSTITIANGVISGANRIAIADTPPPAPTDSTLWWESDTGYLWLRYNDGNSAQWVQLNGIPSAVTAGYVAKSGDTMTGPLILSGDPTVPPGAATKQYVDTTNPGGHVNKLRNGSFDIWQRGTSLSATPGAYTADGWIVSPVGAASLTVAWGALGTAAPPGSGSAMMNIAGAAGVTGVNILQRIEGVVAAPLAGQRCTLQFWVNAAIAHTPQVQVAYANARDNFSAITIVAGPTNLQPLPAAAWTRVAYSFDMPMQAQNGVVVWLMLGALTSGNSYVAAADLRATPGAALGLNANPPPPELRPIHSELLFCQRYLYRSSISAYASGYCPNAAGLTIFVSRTFPLPMRVNPTQSGTSFSNINCNAPSVAALNSNGAVWSALNTAAGSFQLAITGNSDIYTAEL